MEGTTARATAETQSEGEEQAIEIDVSMGFKLPIDMCLSNMYCNTNALPQAAYDQRQLF